MLRCPASFCACLLCCAMNSLAATPMTLRDYLALSGPAPSARLAYGGAPSQYVELFQPPADGPFPVVLLVHGGCWKKQYAGMAQMRNLAGALTAEGIAVWSIEYRRVDEDGGGYPGTFRDVAAALELLESSAAAHRLDTSRVVAMGHSAGGQLVQWIAGRGRIPASSTLYGANPFPVRHIIALGSLGDLRARWAADSRLCGIDVAQLTGRPSAARPDEYSDTSPAELLPNGSHTVLINGELDTLSPPQTALDYAERARRAGDAVETLILPGASHFDEAAATSPAWALVLPVIRRALGMAPPRGST